MNIVITGASKGIGRATAMELSKNKENQILALSRNLEKLNEFKAVSEKEGKGNIRVLEYDLEAPNNRRLEAALEGFSSVDVLINNAGALINKPFLELEKKDWNKMLNVNLVGAAELTQFLFPRLKKSPNAHVVNISSMGGFQGSAKFPGLSAYSASKAAIACLTECLAGEMTEYSIACNCLCLGAVQTEMLAEAFPGFEAPLKDRDMAKYIANFSLTAHNYMNGQIIPVAFSSP